MKFPKLTVQSRFESPLGQLLLAANEGQLVGLWFIDQRHLPDFSKWQNSPACQVLEDAKKQLAEYFSGHRITFDLPINLDTGTEFQQSVWRTLLSIAPGSTCSYASIGTQLGKPKAVRAVGAAIGRNPLSIIVPCHRVLSASGALTGYAGGLARKSALLQLEGASFHDNSTSAHP